MCPTSLQDLLDLDVVGAEAAVELEVVGVVEEGAPEGKQQLLWTEGGREGGRRASHTGGERESDGTQSRGRADERRGADERVRTCEVVTRQLCPPPPGRLFKQPLLCPLSSASHLTPPLEHAGFQQLTIQPAERRLDR